MIPLQFTATARGSQISLDRPLPLELQGRVIVTVEVVEELDYDDSELTPEQWQNAMNSNPALSFLHDPLEDIYTCEDGQPFNLQDYTDEVQT